MKPSERVIGTKTKLAVKLPYAYDNVETYQIKATIHSPLGMGVVTHFTRDELEMFFLDYSPDSDGPFIEQDKGIVGVYKKYRLHENKLVPVHESIVDMGNQPHSEDGLYVGSLIAAPRSG